MKDHIIAALIVTVIVCCGSLFIVGRVPEQQRALGGIDLGLCTVTQSLIAIGNQQSVQILATSTSREWAVIQQPISATNTVSLSLNGNPAVAGSGYQLTPATSTSPVSELAVGFATAYRTQNGVTAITSTGSTTIKVTDCK